MVDPEVVAPTATVSTAEPVEPQGLYERVAAARMAPEESAAETAAETEADKAAEPASEPTAKPATTPDPAQIKVAAAYERLMAAQEAGDTDEILRATAALAALNGRQAATPGVDPGVAKWRAEVRERIAKGLPEGATIDDQIKQHLEVNDLWFSENLAPKLETAIPKMVRDILEGYGLTPDAVKTFARREDADEAEAKKQLGPAADPFLAEAKKKYAALKAAGIDDFTLVDVIKKVAGGKLTTTRPIPPASIVPVRGSSRQDPTPTANRGKVFGLRSAPGKHAKTLPPDAVQRYLGTAPASARTA